MSAEPRRVTNTEAWAQWENHVVNGAFPLRRFLGCSNHSAVFLTEYKAKGLANAAIKIMRADALQAKAQLTQWGTAATLSHPHLVRLFEVGRYQAGAQEFVFVVMEYAEQTLAEILRQRALSPDEVRELLLPTLDALSFLHRNRLVHGQLKPSNFLAVDDQLKLAGDTFRPAGYSATGIARTSVYDPPELKDSEISAAGDIWNLGMTLVEALTQQTETTSLPASVPASFAETVRRCLSAAAVHRPTIIELAAQYKPASETNSIPDPPPPAAVAPPRAEVARSAEVKAPTESSPKPRPSQPVIEAASVDSPKPPSSSPAIAAASLDSPKPRSPSPVIAATSPDSPKPPSSSQTVAATSLASQKLHSPSQASAAASLDSLKPRSPSPAIAASSLDSPKLRSPSPASATVSPKRRLPLPAIAAAFLILLAVWIGWHFSRTPQAPPAQPTVVLAPAPATITKPDEFATPAPPPEQPALPPAVDSSSVLHQVTPDVPPAIRRKIQGRVYVTVRVLVDPSGTVIGVLPENPGPSKYFARLSDEAARDWQFAPADNESARVWLLRFEFTRSGVAVRATAQ